MGDRAHAVIKDGADKVYLYTHWSGTDLPKVVKRALAVATEGDRLDDAPYLARIVFAHMTEGAKVGDTTGFGIATRPCEDTSRDVVIDCQEHTVTVGAGKSKTIAAFISG